MVCKKTLCPLIVLLGVAIAAQAGPQEKKAEKGKKMEMAMPKDRVMVMSKYDFAESLSRVKRAIEQQELMILFTPDHQEMLKMVGLQVSPMTTIEFFHPRYGKTIVQNDMAAAIEIPLRIIVAQKEDGSVMVTYRKPSSIFEKYKGLTELGKELDAVCDKIAKACTS